MFWVICSLVASLLASLSLAQAPLGGGADNSSLSPVQPGDPIFKRRGRFRCDRNFRELDGTCTNSRNKETKLWGSAGRPQFSYFVLRPTTKPRGQGQRFARDVSNILSQQTRNVFDERFVAEIAVFFGQFIDHTIVATPLNEHEEFPIELQPTDSLARSFARVLTQGQNDTHLPFVRSSRAFVRAQDNQERPLNSLSSAVDMTNVYSATKIRNNALRTGIDGKLKVSLDGKNLLPKNTRRFNNAPNLSGNFFLAGDHRANEHPVLTCLHTLFVREHNRIADEVKAIFPRKTEEEMYEITKKINEAQFQKIVFEEWFPAITGAEVPFYRGYQRTTDPTVSLIFSTAGFRIGHTMVGNEVPRKGPGNVPDPRGSLPLTSMFFRVVSRIETDGIETFLRGSMTTRAQKVDLMVQNALRNELFSSVTQTAENSNFDLVALNIQRGRDHALPTLNGVRVRFGRPKATSFAEISSDPAVQSKLQTAYTSAGRVEAFPGLLAEDHAPGSSFGPTLLEIWRREFRRFREGDRFYFRSKTAFSRELRRIPRVRRLLRDRSIDVFREVLLANTNIAPEDLPQKLFMVDRP